MDRTKATPEEGDGGSPGDPRGTRGTSTGTCRSCRRPSRTRRSTDPTSSLTNHPFNPCSGKHGVGDDGAEVGTSETVRGPGKVRSRLGPMVGLESGTRKHLWSPRGVGRGLQTTEGVRRQSGGGPTTTDPLSERQTPPLPLTPYPTDRPHSPTVTGHPRLDEPLVCGSWSEGPMCRRPRVPGTEDPLRRTTHPSS